MDEKYLHDWSGTHYGTPLSVDVPQSVAEVERLVRRYHDHRQPVAIQGGRTGVSGGAAPGDGEVVLSLERLNQIEEFDLRAGLVVVGAGVILEDLQRVVEAEGWSFPLDLGSRGSCQIGGNIATNAGGSRVVKYGTTRSSVLGLEAVLGDGTVIGPPNRMLKNNAGYSLASLMVGSEGTLGIITRAALRLVPLAPMLRTAMLALAPSASIGELLHGCRRRLRDSLSAFEVMWPDYVAGAIAAGAGRELPPAFANARVVLIEVEGTDNESLSAQLESVLGELLDSALLTDVVLSNSARDAADLWRIREAVAEIQAEIRPYVGFDLSIALSDFDEFVVRAKNALNERTPELQSFFFGHAGDSNLHAVVGPCTSAATREIVEDTIYSLLTPLSTSVSAEHGIGRKKKRYLSQSRSAAEIDAMRRLKATFDPHLILNRGRVFD